MAEIVNFVWSWLESGYNRAMDSTKWIWAETKAIFKMAMDALKSIGKKFQAYLSYSRERSWEGKNGAGAERGRDRLDVRLGVFNEESKGKSNGVHLPSDPEKRREARRALREQNREMKEICEGFMDYTNELDEIINNDEEHENQQDTAEKLQKLNQKEVTQKMLKFIEGTDTMVNTSLA